MKSNMKAHKIPGFQSSVDIYRTNSNSSIENKATSGNIQSSVNTLTLLFKNKAVKERSLFLNNLLCINLGGKISNLCDAVKRQINRNTLNVLKRDLNPFDSGYHTAKIKSLRKYPHDSIESESIDSSPLAKNTSNSIDNKSLVSFIYKQNEIQSQRQSSDLKNILADAKNKTIEDEIKKNTNLPLSTSFNNMLITPKFKAKGEAQSSSYDIVVPSIDFGDSNRKDTKESGLDFTVKKSSGLVKELTRTTHRIGSHKYSLDKVSNAEVSETSTNKSNNSILKDKVSQIVNTVTKNIKDKRSNKYRRSDSMSLSQREPIKGKSSYEPYSTISSREDIQQLGKKAMKKDYRYTKFYKEESVGSSMGIPNSATKRDRNFSRTYFHIRNSVDSDEESLKTTVINDNLKMFVWTLSNFFKKKRKVVMRRIVIHNEIKIKKKIYGSKIIFRTLKRRLIFYKLKFIHRCIFDFNLDYNYFLLATNQ